MASASLAKFSELLRHQLYECNETLIPLEKEIAYLENFMELEKLRQNLGLVTEYNINGAENTHFAIAPFILITFVENAFKHVSTAKETNNKICININISDNALHLHVMNTKTPQQQQQIIHYGGIGLKNVQRRLELIYPGKYKLDINEMPEIFSVNCELQLEKMEPANKKNYHSIISA
jgi:LytS/YehU family sensor histidine kinase